MSTHDPHDPLDDLGPADEESLPSKKTPVVLIVVVAVLAIPVFLGMLSALLLPTVAGAKNRAMVARMEADVRTLSLSIEMFHLDHQRYPETLDELANPPDREGVEADTYLHHLPTNPVNDGPYLYERIADGVRVGHLGLDDAEGGEDLDADLWMPVR